MYAAVALSDLPDDECLVEKNTHGFAYTQNMTATELAGCKAAPSRLYRYDTIASATMPRALHVFEGLFYLLFFFVCVLVVVSFGFLL